MRALLVIVPLAAAVDTVLARLRLGHRPTEAQLFLESLAVWSAFALLAVLPALAIHALARRVLGNRSWPLGVWLAFLVWLPVPAHQVLDRHTGVGQDVSGLLTARPWIEVAVLVLVAALVATGIARTWDALARPPVLVGVAALACVVGLFVPIEPAGAPAPAGGAERPNVLLMVWDTAREPSLSTHAGEPSTTPALDRWAESALRFTDARSASVFTFTSHLSMLTGLYPTEHGARLVDQWFDPIETRPLALRFYEAGYRTGGFVGTGVLSARTNIHRGFEVFDDQVDPPACDTLAWKLVHDVQSVLAGLSTTFHNHGRPHWIQDFQRPAGEVLERAREWIERDDPRPFFCLVNLYDVHWPYLPSDPARDRYGSDYEGPVTGFSWRGNDIWRTGYEPTDDDARHLETLYRAEVWDLDAAVASFLEGLEPELRDAVVLLTSDHGEAFGIGGVWEHDDVYEPQVHIPFVLRLPGETAGGEVDGWVSGIDVAPTLLGAAGLEHDDLAGLDLSRERPGPERIVRVEDRDHLDPEEVRLVLYRGSFKLVQRGRGEAARVQLFDLAADPSGLTDVAGDHPDLVAELSGLLAELSVEREREDAGSSTAITDALKGLGYLGD